MAENIVAAPAQDPTFQVSMYAFTRFLNMTSAYLDLMEKELDLENSLEYDRLKFLTNSFRREHFIFDSSVGEEYNRCLELHPGKVGAA